MKLVAAQFSLAYGKVGLRLITKLFFPAIVMGLFLSTAGAADTAPPATTLSARVLAVNDNQVTLRQSDGNKSVLSKTDLQKLLGYDPAMGDDITIIYADDRKTIKDANFTTVTPSGLAFWIALALAAIAVIGAATLASKWRPHDFLRGNDGRYSNSQCQLALWFGTAMTVYLWTLFLRSWVGGLDYIGGISMPQNILLLSGLSALSFGGAKLITTQKVDAVVQATGIDPKTAPGTKGIPAAGAPPPAPAAGAPVKAAPVLSDLFQDDYGDLSLGDFQMILITVTAAAIYLVVSGHALASIALRSHIGLPDVDTSLLGAFGLGQGAYLAKKAALPPGKG